MKVVDLKVKNFFETPAGDHAIDVVHGVPTHVGKSCATQRLVWEMKRLLEGGSKPAVGEAELMAKTRKTPSEVRQEAVKLARYVAKQRERDGDPEGSELIRDLAKSIAEIELLK